ncbi:FAD-dependent monooxygenase [Nocardia sp. NPDC057272]|uniref:FAD-dependent monooxygenase n=1 Tax=Nocardia sp. NPDC057272 TaxID=3346079 RepID=UPI003625E5DB
MNSMRPNKYTTDVVIAGAGPVGLTLAHELGQRGIACVVIEPRIVAGAASPRCKQINPVSMATYRRLGVADAIRANARLPFGWSDSAVFCTSLTGHTIERFDGVFALSDIQRDDLAEPAQWCAQNRLEEALRDSLSVRQSVTTWWGYALDELRQDDSGVDAVTLGPGGERRQIRAKYLVGADGSRSRVRHEIGAQLSGRGHEVQNVQVIFDAPGLSQRHPQGRAVQYWVVNSETNGLMGTLDTDDTWWAIIVDAPPDLTEESARRAVHAMIGEEFPISIRSLDPWQARMLVADTYRSSRCFLAGDAAHQNPPWGGFGANTGIGDAVDLGWKLAAAIEGWAGPHLLDSYEFERRPMALRAIAEAERNMQVLTGELVQPGLDGDSDDGIQARLKTAELIRQTKTAEMYTLGFVLGATYRDSPMIDSPNTIVDQGPTSNYRPSGTPGSRLPHLWLDRSRSLYDVLGPGYTLLEIAAPAVPEWDAAAQQRRLPFTRYRLHRPDLHGYFGARFVLVRPDLHIAWRGDTTPNAGSVLDRARGF